MKPNFLIIGAQKAGTSSLHNYLAKHPQIFMSRIKEPHYFSQKSKPNNVHLLESGKAIINEMEYLSLFADVKDEIAIGESSPSYIYDLDAPIEIHAFNPKMKLIVILRDPVKRAYSNFQHARRSKREIEKNFVRACSMEKERISRNQGRMLHYINKGKYYEQINRYIKLFDKESILVLFHEDLLNNHISVLKKVFNFLQVNEAVYNFSNELIIYNKSRSYSVGFIKLFRWLKPTGLYLFPKLSQKLLDIFFKPKSLTLNEMGIVYAYFEEDILRLEKLLAIDLSHWKHV